MLEHDPQRRAEIKRRLREARKRRWMMSQTEMAELLRHRIDPDNRKYPSERTYVRWESPKANELPQSWKKLVAVATVMEIDLSDLVTPDDEDLLPQFLVAQRLDEVIERLERIESLLEQKGAIA